MKVDSIVREMKRYNMKVVGLHETKWFGCDICDVAGSVVLTSGRSIPYTADSFQRGEGGATVLLKLGILEDVNGRPGALGL